MARRIPEWRQSGQAAIETLVMMWILIVFIAAAYQVHLVNQTIYRSLAHVHQLIFEKAFERNCSSEGSECEYSQDPESEGLDGIAARVIWSPPELPEVNIPMVGMFAREAAIAFGGPPVVFSNRPEDVAADCTGRKCKRTRLGAGTYKSWFRGLAFAFDPDWGGFGFEGDEALGVTLAFGRDVFDFDSMTRPEVQVDQLEGLIARMPR